MSDQIELTYVPTAEEIKTSKSTVIGSFRYPEPKESADEGEHAEACSDLELAVYEQAAQFLNDHFIDTTHAEIRLSEMEPGEIRVYW